MTALAKTFLLLILIIIAREGDTQNYILQEQVLEWENSENLCLFNYNTHLASIHNYTQNEEAKHLAISSGYNAWIGLNDIDKEGTWVYTDGTSFDYGTTLEIDPWNDGEDCIYLSGGWNDSHCTDYSYYSLCGYPSSKYIMNDPLNYERTPSRGHLLGTIDILDEIYIEFDIIIHSWPSYVGSILHIGNSDGTERYPGIYLIYTQKIQIAVTLVNAINYNWNVDADLNTLYHCIIYQTQNHMLFTINGENKINETIKSHPIIVDRNIYFGDPYFDAAEVTISNLVITTTNSHSPHWFNYNCDANNRWKALSSASWTLNDEMCIVQMTDDTESLGFIWLGTEDTTSMDWTDYKTEIVFNIENGTNSVALLVRVQDPPDFIGDNGKSYFIGARYTEQKIVMLNFDGTSITELVSSNVLLEYGTNYTLRVEAVGSTFDIYFENEWLFDVIDSNHSYGAVALKTNFVSVTIYSVRIVFPEPNDCIISAPFYFKEPQFLYYNILSLSEEDKFVYGTGDALSSTIQYFDNRTICNIICNESVACFDTEFIIYSELANIICDGDYSCLQINIVIAHDIDNFTDSSLNVLCNGVSACAKASIDLDYVEDFVLDCHGLNSCADMVINMTNTINTTISCYSENACDSIRIITDNDNITINIHHFSEDVVIDSPTGYNGNNLNCDPQNVYLVVNEEFISYNLLISQIFGEHYPCQEVTFLCNNKTFRESCNIVYVENFDNGAIEEYYNFSGDCYVSYVELSNILDIKCEGTCPQSPTESPTELPTFNPTLSTKSPSSAPSNSPTVSPFNNPTYSPSNSPTNSPSFSPSNSPTVSPSFSPSNSPIYSPTYSPSNAPTASPFNNPTYSPSYSPSNAPTNSPSFSPSDNPTFSPTNNPIASTDFDSYILITYLLENVVNDDKIMITDNAEIIMSDIEWIIESEYFFENVILYENFLVNIQDIDGTKIDEIDAKTYIKWTNVNKLKLNTKIECNEDDNNVNYCASIQQQSQKENSFADDITLILRNYTQNYDLVFTVSNPDSLQIMCKNCVTKSIDYIFYGIAAVSGLIAIIGIFAFIFNQKPFELGPIHIVDDAKCIAVLVFALQVWDFGSDCNLVIEIWTINDVFNDGILIVIAAIGSVLFVIIPYIANLLIATRIKNLIKENSAAKAWFQQNTHIFTLLVVFTGGCYAALALVSSQIFGLEIFTSGLTQYEIKRLGKIKVFGTIILENVPQLMFQGLYVVGLGGKISQTVYAAFFASALSIISTSLSYMIEKDISNSKVVQYYLKTQCVATRLNNDDSDELEEQYDEFVGSNKINNVEKENIITNMGRTKALSIDISELFGIQTNNIEVGHSIITKYGVITHIVHYIDDHDLETMGLELQNDINSVNANNYAINVSPYFFVAQLYASLENEMNNVFRQHFKLNTDFQVKYTQRLEVKYRTSLKNDDDDNIPQLDKKRKTILNRVRSRIEMINNNDDDISVNSMKAYKVLDNLFNKRGIVNENDKMNAFLQMVRNDNKNENENDINDNLLEIDEEGDNITNETRAYKQKSTQL